MLYNINIMIMDRNEMLQDLIDAYAGGNKSKFASLIGVIPQALTGWMNRGTMNKELIYQHLPRVSAHWLLTDGEGEMIVPEVKESPPTDDAKHLKKRIGELERDVNSKQSTIDALQAILADQRETINDLKKDLASSRARTA